MLGLDTGSHGMHLLTVSEISADRGLARSRLLVWVSSAATAAVYLLAGLPELVELCLNVAGGLVDTHVLMTLAALGTLCLGHTLEARALAH